MRGLRRRHGHAKRLTPPEERERLRHLLAMMRHVLEHGGIPLQQAQWAELGKFARKYKYDPAFRDDMFVSGIRDTGRR